LLRLRVARIRNLIGRRKAEQRTSAMRWRMPASSAVLCFKSVRAKCIKKMNRRAGVMRAGRGLVIWWLLQVYRVQRQVAAARVVLN